MAGRTDGESSPSAKGHRRIFTVPPATPFLDALAGAMLGGALTGGVRPSTSALAEMLVYLPAHACAALRAALHAASGDDGVPLTQIRPIDAAEDEALLILPPGGAGEPSHAAHLPPAIGALERRMVLTQLILAWAERVKRAGIGDLGALGLSMAETPAAACELALGLMRLMDEADTEGVDLGKLRGFLPERFAAHEQLSLDFLDIVVTAWPAYLEASGRISPMARRNRLMALEIEALREADAHSPVIVAGSLGDNPATAALMEAVYAHPRGAIVLPGADLWLDDAAWGALPDHPEHPQAPVARLLARLGASRADIACLGPEPAGIAEAARAQFVTQAMRPSSTIAAWPDYVAGTHPNAIRAGLADVSLIAAPTVHDEAATIALILRQAAETEDRTACLVTPDRMLARRVRAQLGKWGLRLPDAAGVSLATTPQGVFHQLVAEAAASGARITLLALLKHPLTRLGFSRTVLEAAIPAIEIAALRQPWAGDGVDQLARSLKLTRAQDWKHAALARLSDAEWDAAGNVIDALAEALQSLTKLGRHKSLVLQGLAEGHRTAAAGLSVDEDGGMPPAGAATEAMAAFMDALASDTPSPPLTLKDYPALFRCLLAPELCADEEAGHPRLAILAPREARLAAADTMVIAGLNEGSWPQAPAASPWLNRAMRGTLGLPPAERQTALCAHDFTQALGAAQVILTRALKAGGTPTVPSRWLLRMEALLGGFGLADALAPKHPWLQRAAGETPAQRTAAKACAPCPPVEARPRQLSISEIATLMANPYAIHARHILGLAPLDRLEAGPDELQRGRILHETLHRFARAYPQGLPENPAAALLEIFDGYTAPFGENARIAAFWRPRMERFAHWFAETEPTRRAGVAKVHAQVSGELTVDAPAGPFTLRGTADRIDLREDGTLAIYDYKGGNLPSEADVASFKAPHLPLEALIASEGHFRGIESRQVAALAYLSAKGGDPAGEEKAAARESAAVLAKAAKEGLAALIAKFDDESTPYPALRRSGFSNRYAHDAYAHLARVEEWAGTSEEG